jgi:hypothetical protein
MENSFRGRKETFKLAFCSLQQHDGKVQFWLSELADQQDIFLGRFSARSIIDSGK